LEQAEMPSRTGIFRATSGCKPTQYNAQHSTSFYRAGVGFLKTESYPGLLLNIATLIKYIRKSCERIRSGKSVGTGKIL